MHIGYLLFPNLTQLDFTGPLQLLSRLPGVQSHFIAQTLAPVATDCGIGLVPTVTFASCPPLDVLVVPGGFGVQEAMVDPQVIDFVQRQAAGLRYLTSVCTGAFILGTAGLLRGRRATTHWAYHHLLTEVGATPVQARVVQDGSLFTGGGVTAGIDFALTLAATLADEPTARRIQLGLEYDPAPPFDSGSPKRADPALVEAVQSSYAPRIATFRQSLREAVR
jgi:cyclohexyl-isocyanide hydratase